MKATLKFLHGLGGLAVVLLFQELVEDMVVLFRGLNKRIYDKQKTIWVREE